MFTYLILNCKWLLSGSGLKDEHPENRKRRYGMTSDMLATVMTKLRALDQKRDLSVAASVLGGLRAGYQRNRGRRKPRRWTGYLADGSRAWFGQRVLLPNGTVGFICAVLRDQAVVRWDDPHSLRGTRFGRFNVVDVERYRLPAAVLLGRSKAGTKERPSERKAEAARINGRMPPGPGKSRGRPRAALPSSTRIR